MIERAGTLPTIRMRQPSQKSRTTPPYQIDRMQHCFPLNSIIASTEHAACWSHPIHRSWCVNCRLEADPSAHGSPEHGKRYRHAHKQAVKAEEWAQGGGVWLVRFVSAPHPAPPPRSSSRGEDSPEADDDEGMFSTYSSSSAHGPTIHTPHRAIAAKAPGYSRQAEWSGEWTWWR